MYKRLSAFLFPIVTIVLVGAMIWGYQENREKNSILIKAENQYQRAFHDLSFHVDNLHTELGNALAVNSTSQIFHRKCLINAWRLTSEAQSDINQLPLTLLPFHKTEEFLSKIAKFSYQTAVRDLDKEPLTPDEMKTLKTLYEHSNDISKDLKEVQSQVISENLRWMDVEVAMAREDETSDNSVINGFKTVDKKVSSYPEVNWGPSVASIFENRSYESLSGTAVRPEEIKRKAAKFLSANGASMKIVENGPNTDFQTYSVMVSKAQEKGNIQMDYTKKGGHLIWFMDDRQVESEQLTIDQARDKALQFLEKHQYESMRAINYDQYNNVANITFARAQDDVIIYPEKLSVKVALDNGEITGLQAADYIFSHKQRNIEKPGLTLEQAKKKLNPNFKFTDNQLALIENELNEEVLCYQFLGKINGARYKIYINADTGIEEKIEQVQ